MQRLLILLVIAITAGCSSDAPSSSNNLSSPNEPKTAGGEVAAAGSVDFFAVDKYDGKRDAYKDLRETVAETQAANQHILLIAGGDW